MPKLQSMDVTLRGVTKTFVFDPATPVESSDDGEASLEVLADAETTEVVLIENGIYSARVSVSYSFRVEGTVEIDLEDLDGVEDPSDVVYAVEGGDFDHVGDSIRQDIEYNLDGGDWNIDNVEIEECFDEDGNTVEL